MFARSGGTVAQPCCSFAIFQGWGRCQYSIMAAQQDALFQHSLGLRKSAGWFSSLAKCSRAAFQQQGLPVAEVGQGGGALAMLTPLFRTFRFSQMAPKPCQVLSTESAVVFCSATIYGCYGSVQCRRRTQTCRHCWVSACDDAIAAAGCCCLVLAVQLMWAAISIIGMMFMQPTDPSKTNPRTVVQLQQFSWTEAALEESIKVNLPVPRSFKDAWHAFLEGHSSFVYDEALIVSHSGPMPI